MSERKQSNAFKDFTPTQIINSIQLAAKVGSFCYVVDKADKLCGLIMGVPHAEQQEIHITQVLCSKPKVLAQMVKEFKIRFPGWNLTANRHGKLIQYKNTNRLCNKILTLT